MMKDHGAIDGRQVIPAAWIDAVTRPTKRFPGHGYFTWLGRGLVEAGPPKDTPDCHLGEPYQAPDLFMRLGYGGQRVYISRDYDLVVMRLGPFAGMTPLAKNWDNAQLINTVIRGIRL
jgi:CubicO group peptidase (beta-lactamase class C family)